MNCERNVCPTRAVGQLQAVVYWVVLVGLGGLIGVVIQVVVTTSTLTFNFDIRYGLLVGAAAGFALFVTAYFADEVRCPICRTRNMQAPR